jgi:ABC-type multidrug transport system ATPase subunit
MKQKLALCCALIHRPVVLFLDEPTTGVDAVSRKEFWDMLKRLKYQGITILVSTPYMDEAALCDRVALIQSGKILSTGTPANITGSFANTILAVKSEKMYPLLRDLEKWHGANDSYSFGEFHHVIMKDEYNAQQLRSYLNDRAHANVEIHTAQANIEDCFMQLMQN